MKNSTDSKGEEFVEEIKEVIIEESDAVSKAWKTRIAAMKQDKKKLAIVSATVALIGGVAIGYFVKTKKVTGEE